jgi:hypothetical protein
MGEKRRTEASLERWIQVGERLRKTDPSTFAELLELGDQFALVHEDIRSPALRRVGDTPTIATSDEASHDLD